MSTTNRLPLAVSTYVLAALAVSAPVTACPLGPQISVDQPTLPWARTHPRTLFAGSHVLPSPKLTLRTIIGGDGAALLRALSKLDLACGNGRGELTLRIGRGAATATITGFDPIATSCITRAIEQARFTRIANGALARLSIELP